MSNCVKQTLENFKFSTLQNNTITGIVPPRVLTAGVETRIATLTVPADCDDFVWLSATVGWATTLAAGAAGTLVFRIYRDNELTPIFSTQQSSVSTVPVGLTTSFSHVDYNFPCTSDCVTYILTVTADAAGFSLTGPITFIAAVIENKRYSEDHDYKPECKPEYKPERKPHCESHCKPHCECQCKPHCESQCKPYYKSYGQKFDFD